MSQRLLLKLIFFVLCAKSPILHAQEIDMYGRFGITRDGVVGTAYIQTIENYRPLWTVSGTLALQVWATALPYFGGTLFGYKMAEADLGTLNGGYLVRDVYARALITDPPPGTYNLVFVLAEWGGFSYLTVDWENLGYDTFGSIAPSVASPVVADTVAPTLALVGKTRLVTGARSISLRGSASDNASLDRLEYRVDPPGRASWGSWATGNSPTSGRWTQRIRLPKKGVWKVQLRVVDRSGNFSVVRTVRITRS